jgi:MoaA/NifB/PqqE/SkfB family radical SAM enzyme
MEINYLTLIPTLSCNKSCAFCPVELNNANIDIDVAKKAIELFIKSNGNSKIIKFFGGEPFLRYDLLKKLVIFSKIRAGQLNKIIKFTISTNGILIGKNEFAFVKNNNIELVIDSIWTNEISKQVLKDLFSYSDLVVTINIPAYSPRNASKQVNDFYDLGVRKFNILPAYYCKWSKANLVCLKTELEKIRGFYCTHSDITLKNMELKGDFPLFNTCLTCDPKGNLFLSNIAIAKHFTKLRKKLFVGNVCKLRSIPALSGVGQELVDSAYEMLPRRILKDTLSVHSIFEDFISLTQKQGKVADIKLGNSCNNHCRFCARKKSKEKLNDLSVKAIREKMLIARKSCSNIVLTGGEPAIRRDFLQLVSFAKELKYNKINIQSNGRIFAYNDFCKAVISAGVNEFVISLHGHIPQLHDYLTSCDGSFYQTLAAIKNLRKLKQVVFANTVIVKSNYRHLPEIIRLLIDLEVDQAQFAFVHAIGSAEENFSSIVPRYSLVLPYVKEALNIGSAFGLRVMTEAFPYCLMKGYEDHVAEKIIPKTLIFESNNEVFDFEKVRPELAKSKCGECKKCSYFSVCEGPWKEYPERFGWKEFNPVI